VALERLDAGAIHREVDCPGGEEIFILSGDLRDGSGNLWCRDVDQKSGRIPEQSRLDQRSDILGEARSSAPRCHDGKTMTTHGAEAEIRNRRTDPRSRRAADPDPRLQRIQLSGHRRQPRHTEGQYPLSFSFKGRSRNRSRRPLRGALRRGPRRYRRGSVADIDGDAGFLCRAPISAMPGVPTRSASAGAFGWRNPGAATGASLPRRRFFFRAHQAWLTGILKRGVARGEFKLPAPASKTARFRLRSAAGSAAGQNAPPAAQRSYTTS